MPKMSKFCAILKLKPYLTVRAIIGPSGPETVEWTFEDRSTKTVDVEKELRLVPDEKLISIKPGEALLIKGILQAAKPGEYTVAVSLNFNEKKKGKAKQLGTHQTLNMAILQLRGVIACLFLASSTGALAELQLHRVDRDSETAAIVDAWPRQFVFEKENKRRCTTGRR